MCSITKTVPKAAMRRPKAVISQTLKTLKIEIEGRLVQGTKDLGKGVYVEKFLKLAILKLLCAAHKKTDLSYMTSIECLKITGTLSLDWGVRLN